MEDFRAENLIVDLGAESSQLIEKFLSIEENITQLNLVKSYYRYIIDFLSSDIIVNEFSFPTLSGIEDEMVTQLADQLITLSTSLEAYSYSLSLDNPAIQELKEQIEFTKNSDQFVEYFAKGELRNGSESIPATLNFFLNNDDSFNGELIIR